MAITIRGEADEALALVEGALLGYQRRHPEAQIDVYRQNSISIRIRVVDPYFIDLSRPNRHDLIWKHLEKLPEEIQSDVSMVVLLSPLEVGGSLGNLEFENPSPSLIK